MKKTKQICYISGSYFEIYEFENEKYFEYEANRADYDKSRNPKSVSSVARSRNTLRRLVLANFDNDCLFVTLTFKENVTSLKKASYEFKKFILRLKVYYPDLLYVCVPEFQKRGAVHYHIIFKNVKITPYKERKTRFIANIWGQGFVDVTEIHGVGNVGAYVCKYMSKGKTNLFDSGNRLYYRSKGLVMPSKVRDMQLAKDFLKGRKLDKLFEKQYLGNKEIITYRQYKIYGIQSDI